MTSPLRALATLEAVAHTYGGSAAGTKLAALEVLDGTALPNVAAVRRLHDTSRSGLWFLLILIPFIGAIVLIVFMAQDGTPGENQFGKNPKEVMA